jgi:hypothetical protein
MTVANRPYPNFAPFVRQRGERKAQASAKATLQQPDSSRLPHDSGNRSKIRRMNAFRSGRDAKEFLISRIVAEGQRENVSLSEVERKMLYFAESGSTLPDMTAVSAHFDSEYNQNEYEHKIARLI